ncbi:hypothetical protein [Aliarcobacter butzleri]|uniref:hypothetical protein n=1 Tax=Aliarcobacter butzleri TaxID=28197 RepID=UPI0021B442BB|nr:hypothetical protein [Aliarcobacter butzleri]UWY61353.1 hypothetical protein N3115_11135 [Aliarcobacter butzleri]
MMQNITTNELIAIKHWTSSSPQKFYRNIKEVAQNKYLNKEHLLCDESIKWFESLENMFLIYEDNTNNYKQIFRADIIENKCDKELNDKELFESFCEKFKINKSFQMDEIICSFSLLKHEALKTAKLNDKYKGQTTPIVMYILENRVTKYLYIAPFSCIEEEEEVLTLGLKNFKIIDIKKFDNNYIEIYIDEII